MSDRPPVDYQTEDVIVSVTMPAKDYKILRDMIEERQAMDGLKKWLQTRVFWLAGGLLTIFGVFEAVRRFGAE